MGLQGITWLRNAWTSQGNAHDRVLVLWWGSIKGGDVTLGDYMAAGNLALGLQARGLDVELAAFHRFPIPCIQVVHPLTAARSRYGTVVFVCGPIRTNRRLIAMLERYRGLKRIAAAVTVVPEDPDILGYFDEVIARDGTDDAMFDLALADPWRQRCRYPTTVKSAVATCYRGRQGNISPNRHSLHELAESLMEPVAMRLSEGHNILRIDTRTPTPVRIPKIAGNFTAARLVLTTRLHGALLSLEHRAPFVALDQIERGQKVNSVLKRLDWPYHFIANEVTQNAIFSAAKEVMQPSFQSRLEHLRCAAIGLANNTLTTVCDVVVDAVGKN
jgi:hypothetical protein